MLNFNEIVYEIVNEYDRTVHTNVENVINAKLYEILSNQSITENKEIIDKYGNGYFNALTYFKNIVGKELKVDYDDEHGFYVALAYASIFNRVYHLVLESI